MARGDATRDKGKKLDKTHTELVRHLKDLRNDVQKLDGILAKKIVECLMTSIDMLDSEFDDIQSIYSELDEIADELDSDESEDESAKREIEKDLAAAQERIEELESENDDSEEDLT